MEISRYDCLVIGSGPAGLAAACAASDCGLEVAVVDDQSRPGGQLFRQIHNPDAAGLFDPQEYREGQELLERFAKSGVDYRPETTVWSIDGELVSCTRNDKSERIRAGRIVVACGGMERPVPFPGWTLPGVMGAGAVDIMLRSGCDIEHLAEKPLVLAGNGPLLLALACHLIERNVPIAAWLDSGDMLSRLKAAPAMALAPLDLPYLRRGLGMAVQILKKRVPIIRKACHITAEGTDRLEAVSWRDASGQTQRIEADLLVRHEGIIPRTHIANALDLTMLWDERQRYWYPKTDINGCTSRPEILIAGDASFVHGGEASICKGTLAGVEVARQLQVIDGAEAAWRTREALPRLKRINRARFFLQQVFAPNPEIFNVPDETLVCRCECVTAAAIRQAVGQGHKNINEIKRFTRCGMGPCQGRMCGPALAEIAAGAAGCSTAEVGMLHVRMPFRPVSLRNYCALNGFEEQESE